MWEETANDSWCITVMQLSAWDFNFENIVGVSCGRIKIIYYRKNLSQDSIYLCNYFCQNCVIDNNLLANLIKLWTNGVRNCEEFWIEPWALLDGYYWWYKAHFSESLFYTLDGEERIEKTFLWSLHVETSKQLTSDLK